MRTGNKDAARGCSRTGEAHLQSPQHGHVGQPRPAWALGLGGCPHQALSNPPCLLCLHQVFELFPPEQLCGTEEGFPGSLWNSRSWEMAARSGAGDLVSPCSGLCSWGDSALRERGHALAQTPRGLFPASLLGFEICTLATLCTWSLMWKKRGSRPSRTVFFISLSSFRTTIFIRSLKRLMELSLSWLSSWEGAAQ